MSKPSPSAPLIIETLATGDEVVNGDVVDSNSAYVSRRLAALGHLVTRHGALPDDLDLLTEGLREIAARADLCICSGGLGPTSDDLTVDVAARVAGTAVRVDEEALRRMKERFAKARFHFTENNVRSARVPEGAEALQNEAGTAPGFRLTLGKCLFFFLPGVPKEFRFFADAHVVPWVAARWPGGASAVVQLKTLGWAESHLAELFDDFAGKFPGIKIGYRAHAPEVWLKLTASAGSRAEAQAALTDAVAEAARRLGPTLFGRGDEELPELVHGLLTAAKLRFAAAESCTGGQVAQLLTALPGSSAYFQGSAVTYSNESKTALLGVPAELLVAHGAVSAECAEAMARGALDAYGAQLAISITGIAGPAGGSPEKPVGLVYLALGARSAPDAKELVTVLKRVFRGDRERIQKTAAMTALEMVRRHLAGLPSIN